MYLAGTQIQPFLTLRPRLMEIARFQGDKVDPEARPPAGDNAEKHTGLG